MKYSIDKQEQYTLLTLEETKLDSLLAPQLKAELVKLNAEGQRNIIMDMSEVKYTDSSGLSALLTGHKGCREMGGIFVITGVSEHVDKLIKISQLESILTLMPTKHEAVEYVFMEEIEKNLRGEMGEEG